MRSNTERRFLLLQRLDAKSILHVRYSRSFVSKTFVHHSLNVLPVYGMVFRIQSDQAVPPSQDKIADRGQWRSLAAGNKLLSTLLVFVYSLRCPKTNVWYTGDRFGARGRPYITHQAQGASLPILHEMSTIWETDLASAVEHPFRETVAGPSDPSLMFMLVHFVIERWREALLWSWVVGKHGGLDDSWTGEIAEGAWKELGGTVGEGEVAVKARLRKTMDPERVAGSLKKSGHRNSDVTKYEWCKFKAAASLYVTNPFFL